MDEHTAPTDGSAVAPAPLRAGATGPAKDRPPAIATVEVSKIFPGVVANDRVSFEAMPGEVHALLGENGAGKTTLCNILTGLYRPDGGELRVFGEPVRFRSPRDAHQAGIVMVHQHFALVPSLTVAENVVLGWSKRSHFWFAPGAVEDEVAAVAERFQIPVDPKTRVWQLSVGEQQRVEILKALYRGAKILILDEPTTVLTPQEADQLFASLRDMAAAGSTVIFISHKLPEVTAVSNRVTVLRAGRCVGTVATAGSDARSLARLMVGHDVHLARKAASAGNGDIGGPVLEVADLSADGDLGTPALRGVTLSLRAGEIVGLAGVTGNGQRELAEVIGGLRHPTAGTVRIAGRATTGSPSGAIDAGLAYVPEDRMGMGVASGLPIEDNMILKSYRGPPHSTGPLLHPKEVMAFSTDLMERFNVKAPSALTLVRELSGGNVQKVLLAREMSSSPKVLVAASPTRGLDVSATESVRGLLLDAAANGVGVLLISEDLDEILDLSDRIAVIYEGRIVGVVDAEAVDVAKLGEMMGGMDA